MYESHHHVFSNFHMLLAALAIALPSIATVHVYAIINIRLTEDTLISTRALTREWGYTVCARPSIQTSDIQTVIYICAAVQTYKHKL